MTDKEKILDEIVRIRDENETYPNKDKDLINSSLYEGRKQVCQMLLDFINSLPSEKSSEDLEYLATSLEETIGTSPHSRETIISYLQQTAQWQKEKDIDKVCEWLNKNVVEYHPRTGELKPVVNLNAFREAMEDEQ